VSSVAHDPSVPRLAHEGRVTQARVALSEWTKLRSVRSTRYSLIAAVLFTIGLAALACAVVAHHYPSMSLQDRADFHPMEVNLVGVQLAQLAIGILGILVITAEYSTGMIRASMTAVPKRLPVLWAKALVYGLVTAALMIPAVLIAFLIGPGDLVEASHQRGFLRSRRRTRALRRRALPHGCGSVRARTRCDRPEHGRRDRNLRRDHVRSAAIDERPPGELERRGLAVPAPRCR
jgi:hypothetical protein